MKITKNVDDIFSVTLWPKCRIWGELQRGCPPIEWCLKKKNTAFDEVIGNFQVPVSTLLEVVLHAGKGAKFGVQKVNGGRDICSRPISVVEKGRIVKNMLRALRDTNTLYKLCLVGVLPPAGVIVSVPTPFS